MKKQNLIILLVLLLVCIMAGCKSDNDDPSDSQNGSNPSQENADSSDTMSEENLVLSNFSPVESYSSKGMCYIEDCIAHFFDAETGTDIVLCSKPNCPHKRTTEGTTNACDAYLGYDARTPFLTGDSIYFITSRESDAGLTFDKYVVRTDLDGRNRKELVKLEGVQSIICSEYDNGYLAACYINSMDLDKKEYFEGSEGAFSYGNKEKRESGIYLINTATGEIEFMDSFSEHYDSYCWNCGFYDNKLYYLTYYTLNKIEYSNYEDLDKYYEDVSKNAVQQIYEYDIKTKTKVKIWEGGYAENISINGYGYISIEDEEKIVFIKGGKEIARFMPDELSYDGCDQHYTWKYVYNNVIYMVNGKRVWYKDMSTGDIQYVAGGKLNGKGIYRIDAIIGKWIYYLYEADGKQYECAIEKESFLSGDLSSAKIMITRDAPIRVEPEDSQDVNDNNSNNDMQNGNNDNGISDKDRQNNNTNAMDSKTYIENLLASEPEADESIDDIDENTIVWALMRIGDEADKRTERINKKLKDDGYPYEILIQQLDTLEETLDYRKAMMKAGADVVYTGMPSSQTDETAWDPAYEAIMKNKLLKLDDYLKGSKLYDMIPEKLWDSVRVDGSIYCIPNPALRNSCFSIVFKKSAYTEEQLQNFDDTIGGLTPFISAENKLYYGDDRFVSMYGIHSNTYGIYYTDDGFGNLTGLDEYVNGLTALNSLAQAGMVINPRTKGFEESKDEWSVAFCDDFYTSLLNEDDYYIRTYRGIVEPGFNSSIAIKASSHNPDGAFKLIELIMTDPEYAKLAVYGENVILKDGFAYDTEKEKYAVGYLSRLQFGVKELVYPDKDSYLTRFESIEAKKEYYASNFDPVNMSELKYPVEMLKLRNLAYDNETIIFKKDFSERLKKWQQETDEIFLSLPLEGKVAAKQPDEVTNEAM